MFLLLFFLSFSSEVCHSQMVYSRMVPQPYDPRYVLHRPPVRRSAMEALERLRLPVTRYFPQVDSQVASARYQPAPASPLSGYQLSTDDLYALPPQWTDDFVQQLPPETDDNDYGNYEYEGAFAPVYRPSGVYGDEVYAQPEPVAEPEPSDNAYNDYMVNYFLGAPEPVPVDQFDLQRRSSETPSAPNDQGVISLSTVLEANKNSKNNATSSSVSDTTVAPSVPVPSQVPPQVQMTAVPSAPEKKEIKSLVIPAPAADDRDELSDIWREAGQKEEPLFRPLQNSQRTTWEVLTRAKNSVLQKRPIPLLKKMIQSGQQQKSVDTLTEELKNLKKERSV